MSTVLSPHVALLLENVGKTFRVSGAVGRPESPQLDVDTPVDAMELDDDLEKSADEPDDRTSKAFGRRQIVALHDVSLEVPSGQVVGIVGPTGSGKTTLIRLLSRTLPPTTGRIVMRDPVSPAIPDLYRAVEGTLTGAQNVSLLAQFAGFDEDRLRSAIPSIAAFAGLEEHIDVVVSRWASGFAPRLVAATVFHANPGILLSEGPPAVGDPAFRERCLGAARDLVANGTTIIAVLPDARALRTTADIGVWLEGGTLVAVGPAVEIADAYEKRHGAVRLPSPEKLARAEARTHEKQHDPERAARAAARAAKLARAEQRAVSAQAPNGPRSPRPEDDPDRLKSPVKLSPIRITSPIGESPLVISITIRCDVQGTLRCAATLRQRDGSRYRVGVPAERDVVADEIVLGTIVVPPHSLSAGSYVATIRVRLIGPREAPIDCQARGLFDVETDGQASAVRTPSLTNAAWEFQTMPSSAGVP